MLYVARLLAMIKLEKIKQKITVRNDNFGVNLSPLEKNKGLDTKVIKNIS